MIKGFVERKPTPSIGDVWGTTADLGAQRQKLMTRQIPLTPILIILKAV
jgi:hypothetical protein